MSVELKELCQGMIERIKLLNEALGFTKIKQKLRFDDNVQVKEVSIILQENGSYIKYSDSNSDLSDRVEAAPPLKNVQLSQGEFVINNQPNDVESGVHSSQNPTDEIDSDGSEGGKKYEDFNNDIAQK